MKKLRMIVTSVVVLAIVGSAFAFNAKKVARFCYTPTFNHACAVSSVTAFKRVAVGAGLVDYYYLTDWDGNSSTCTSSTCTVKSGFTAD